MKQGKQAKRSPFVVRYLTLPAGDKYWFGDKKYLSMGDKKYLRLTLSCILSYFQVSGEEREEKPTFPAPNSPLILHIYFPKLLPLEGSGEVVQSRNNSQDTFGEAITSQIPIFTVSRPALT